MTSKKKILFTSVFGPYAQDDEYGSRAINPMELYQNQVTRGQGVFSLRMFHRSWGIMMIQENISNPSVLLDFPSRDRFISEIKDHDYDIIGITSIIPNVEKVKEMCSLIRQHRPKATIVVGGHVSNYPNLKEKVNADHVVRGEGIRWFREFLGEDIHQPIRHPMIKSGFKARTLGTYLSEKPGEVAATLIPSVGCPMGCNFCATSAMFGGKGSAIHFFKTGQELFDIMCEMEKKLKVQSFFVMDENFLLYRKRALELLALMDKHNKSWALYVFSSAHVLSKYTMEELVGLGISWVWMGLEGKKSRYDKLKGIETISFVKKLREHGIRVLGSSIIGLENHTPENIHEAIDYAVEHNTEFHQFMLYTPSFGTELYKEHEKKGDLLPNVRQADNHGQFKFNFRHPFIKNGQETEFLKQAFKRDFNVNGPSVLRVLQTSLLGWKKYKNHFNPRIRNRFKWEARSLSTLFAGSIWASKKWFKQDSHLYEKYKGILKELYKEYGLKARLMGPFLGRIIFSRMRSEKKRLQKGWTCEPPTFYEKKFS